MIPKNHSTITDATALVYKNTFSNLVFSCWKTCLNSISKICHVYCFFATLIYEDSDLVGMQWQECRRNALNTQESFSPKFNVVSVGYVSHIVRHFSDTQNSMHVGTKTINFSWPFAARNRI